MCFFFRGYERDWGSLSPPFIQVTTGSPPQHMRGMMRVFKKTVGFVFFSF